MKFLVDNSISHAIARGLAAAGFDGVHVRDYGLQAAADEVIFERPGAEGRTIIAADSDFARILALRGVGNPSLVLSGTTRRDGRPSSLPCFSPTWLTSMSTCMRVAS